MGYVVYSRVQIWFIIFGWLVLFSSSFRGISLISLKGRGGYLSLLVYSCSLVVCLLFLDHVCTWRGVRIALSVLGSFFASVLQE